MVTILLQYCVPQLALSRLAGLIANCRWPWLKNGLITWFIKRYHVNMQEAEEENPTAYANFNAFFTRALKSERRPIVQEKNALVCPVDGCISQIGKIENDTLFQAKGFYFDVKTLIGNDNHAFQNGHFATLYLAPKDYHRIHMPIKGQLIETTHIPGKLFSVNTNTTAHVPTLFARNERVVCLFETEIGPMAVILVGAMIVGSIQITGETLQPHPRTITRQHYSNRSLNRGDELGYFKLGSTVILLFPADKIHWKENLSENTNIIMGQSLGTFTL